MNIILSHKLYKLIFYGIYGFCKKNSSDNPVYEIINSNVCYEIKKNGFPLHNLMLIPLYEINEIIETYIKKKTLYSFLVVHNVAIY